MVKQAKTQYVLLGLLTQGPRTGYELKKTIEMSIGHFWQESYGQIYPVLMKLNKEELISLKNIVQTGKPDKKIYSITSAGKKHFRKWLAMPVDASPMRHELLLKTFFSNMSSTEILLNMLKTNLKENVQLNQLLLDIKKNILSQCKKIESNVEPQPIENSPYSLLTLEYGIMYSEMNARWAELAIKMFRPEISK